MRTLQFIPIYSDAIVPTKAYISDGGYDLYSYLNKESITIQPLQRYLIGTGIRVILPSEYDISIVGEGIEYVRYYPQAFITPKSGRSHKEGLTIVNSPGLIDNTYTGEIKVNVYNSSPVEPLTIKHLEKVAQLVRIDVPQDIVIGSDIYIADNISRGDKGYGSTGLT